MACKYCDDVFSGNCCDDILTGDLKMGSVKIGDISVFITENWKSGDAVLELYAEVADTPIIKSTVPIKFCPFCGKKLIMPAKAQEDFRKRFWS